MKTTLPPAKKIAIFNPRKKLVATVVSATAAAKLTHLQQGNICSVCNGKQIATHGYYVRYVKDDVPLVESLEEYDRLCGLDRIYYKTVAMNRKGWKYKKRGN